MSEPQPSIAQRKAAVLARTPIGDLVEAHVKLSGARGSTSRRGKCPFHNGNSPSFAVKSPANHADGFAHCFGCQWHGHAIDFLMAIRGWSFLDALIDLEGGEARAPDRGPVQRERNPSTKPRRQRALIEPIDMGRALWRMGRTDPDAVRRYFTGRGVPAGVLTDDRLTSFRFVGLAPVMQWELGARPDSVLQAPALVALVRDVVWLEDSLSAGSADVGDASMPGAGGRWDFVPCGVHVTYLNPDGTGTMLRRKPWAKPDDEDPHFPKRRMLGPVGKGAVLLGRYAPRAPLFVGEGNETVLSGMALAAAPAEAVGVATLSLDNLQGQPRKWTGGIWPLHAIEPDAERPGFLIPGHAGAVTGLVDSDMSPLRQQKVVARKGAGIETRAITGAERARICAELFVKRWRQSGASPVDAVRAPIGMDFNDVVQAEAA